ncbi:MAG TPA: hypothetical protein VKT70_13635, partial [Stellaceae bacterium]|nr:hypothetical protein [Stellaceae bacterium]
MRRILRLARLTAYLAVTLPAMAIQFAMLGLGRALGGRVTRLVPRPYHHLCCRLLGFDLEWVGTPSRACPTLFV